MALLEIITCSVILEGLLVATISRAIRSVESRSVWCGLRPELCQIEIRSCAVAAGHRLAESSLGEIAIVHDTIKRDGETFDHDLDDAAYERPILESANQIIVNFVLE